MPFIAGGDAARFSITAQDFDVTATGTGTQAHIDYDETAADGSFNIGGVPTAGAFDVDGQDSAAFGQFVHEAGLNAGPVRFTAAAMPSGAVVELVVGVAPAADTIRIGSATRELEVCLGAVQGLVDRSLMTQPQTPTYTP